jgi:hypothetical protein
LMRINVRPSLVARRCRSDGWLCEPLCPLIYVIVSQLAFFHYAREGVLRSTSSQVLGLRRCIYPHPFSTDWWIEGVPRDLKHRWQR